LTVQEYIKYWFGGNKEGVSKIKKVKLNGCKQKMGGVDKNIDILLNICNF